MKVEIGCGSTKNEGFIGIDRFELPGVDIVADINKGLPLEENQVSLLFSSHSLEHFADLPTIMKEIYRVCKHGAQVCIVVPYHETLLNKSNPYHLQVFNEHTFRFFSKESNYFTESKDFVFPHAKDYGLLYSDNSNLNVNFVLANIEYFYFDGFDILSADEQRYYRKHCNDVCDQVIYHLLVIKEDLPDYELKNLIKNTNLYYPSYVLERKSRLRNKIESLEQDEINEIKKSILNPISLEIFKNQEKKQQELEDQNSELNFKISNQEKKQQELEDQNSELNFKISNQEKKQQELEDQNSELNFKISNQEKKQQELEDQNSELNFKISNQEKKQQELEDQNSELNFKISNQEKKQQELEDQNSELNFKIENQIRLFSLYTKNKRSLFQKINYFKLKDNIIENMNIGSFNRRMVMNLKNDMSNYKVKFSSFIKAYPYYNEYCISSNNKISSLEIYVDVFSKVNLTFEIVQDNKILYNQVVSVNKSGTLVLAFPEIENNFKIRFQVKSILEYMTIAEWYPSSFLAKFKSNTLLCCIAN